MARGSRHKSSRHSVKDAKESSDSEDYSSPRDPKGKENGSRVLKGSASCEKRRFDSKDTKDFYGSENLETEEHGHSKRRKERYDEGTADRWNGGSDDELGVPSKKSKASGDSKSKRRDESVGLQNDGEELKKSGGKGEGRHRESSRKDGRSGGGERERKGREGRSDRVVVSKEHHLEKQMEKNTEDVLTSSGLENRLEIRIRKRAGSFDGDKHRDDGGDIENRQSYSKNDVTKDGKRRIDKHKDERNKEKEKCWEDADRDDKHRDEQLIKDHVSRSNDRDLRHEKDATDLQQKRNKPQDGDPNRELTKAKACEGDLDAIRDKERDKDRHRAYERDRDQESRRGRDRDRGHDQDQHESRNRSRSRAHDRYYDYECDFDRDESHLEDQSTKYMDSKGRKRSPNDHDDSIDTRSKTLKNSHTSNEKKKSFSDDIVEPDSRKGSSESRSRHADFSLSSHRRKDSPSSLSCVGMDEYRHPDQKDLRDQYSKKEERSKSTSIRDQSVYPGSQEKGSKYTYMEKSNDVEGGSNSTGMLRETSQNSKNIDIEESGRRHSASIDAKDLSSNKDRLNWDLPIEKPLMDESSQAESSSYSKASQSNPSSFHPRPVFRTGVDIPFDDSIEDESRLNSNIRFRRSGDPNLGRLHGNTWRGVPNWTAPGFVPFQHGPPHGSFQSIMPQFSAPPLFGIRPPLEINHSGIPYGMPDAERFPSHLHPLGWHNMLDGSSPSHLHGWDGSNGIFRDESRIHSGAEWEENRQMVNGRGWESRGDMWKRQSGNQRRELPSHSQKKDHAVQDPVDDVSSREVCDESFSCILQKTGEMKPIIMSFAKESPSTPELPSETLALLERSIDDTSKLSSAYLAKLEISAELAHPDLYHQCSNLMDFEQCAAVNEESSVCIIIEGGAIAVSMMSSNSVHQCLSHPVKNSIFQRAVDLYKKQRMQMRGSQIVTGEKLDGVLASFEGSHEEKGLNFDDEKVKIPPSTAASVETSHVPISTTNGNKAVETNAALGKPEDFVSTAHQVAKCLDEAAETTAALGKVEDLVSTAHQVVKCLENLEEPLPILKATEVDVMGSEQQTSLGTEKDTVIPSDDANTSADVNIKGIGNGNNSMRCGVVNPCFDNAVSGSVSSFSDEIPEVCEGLMPVSIRSASLILSRIHHSPESTH